MHKRLFNYSKKDATKAELLQLKPHPFICMRNFITTKVGNQKAKPTFIISVLKVVYQVALLSLISNFFSNKISHANKWMRKKISTCNNSALLPSLEFRVPLRLTSFTSFLPFKLSMELKLNFFGTFLTSLTSLFLLSYLLTTCFHEKVKLNSESIFPNF